MSCLHLIGFILLNCVYLGHSVIPDPDLYWSFDDECQFTACPLCFNPEIPAGDRDYWVTGECGRDGSVGRNYTTEGIIGEAMVLENLEAAVNKNNETIIFDRSKEDHTLCFWMKLHSISLNPSRPLDKGFLFHTAFYNIITRKPLTTGIIILVDAAKKITARVQNQYIFYEIAWEKPIPIDEWVYFTVVWKKVGFPEAYFNGTKLKAGPQSFEDVIVNERNDQIILGENNHTNFTIDELKIWFEKFDDDKVLEIFQEASIDPSDFTTVPVTTKQEETTTTSTTTVTTTTKKTTTTTTTRAPTTTTPRYLSAPVPVLEKISKELHENNVENKIKNLTIVEELQESSEKTSDIIIELKEIVENEDVQLEHEIAISYISDVSESTNTLVAEENAKTWQEVEDKVQSLNIIIETADDVNGALVEVFTPPAISEIQIVHTESVSIAMVPPQTEEPVSISPSSNVKVGLSVSTVTSLSQNTPVIVAATIHSGANTCYDDIPAAEVDIIDRTPARNATLIPPVFDENRPLQIITEIVSINIKPKLKTGDLIKLSFKHTMNLSNFDRNEFTLYCAYINKNTTKWTNHKCTITDSNDTHTTFTTTHLTNFAILMQVVDIEISEDHIKNLSLITYIGSSISIFCLVLSLCVFALVKNAFGDAGSSNIRGHRTERYHLHANLALSMLLGQVTFLVGADYEPGTESCKATAILLHFFYMSAFSWMLVEGLHLYNLVVKVFRSSQSKLGYYYMFGWGIPFLICVVSVATAFNGYGEVNNCWLDKNNSRVIWAFVGPALFVILVNTIILAKVTHVISTLAKSKDNRLKCMTDKATVVVCAKGVAVLMPILGVAWVFGVLAVNEDLIIFQYVFAVCNSLQGFFLFVFHCIFNSETRASLKYRTRSFRPDFQSKSATNSRSRRQTKVDLVKNAEQMNSDRPFNTTTTSIHNSGPYNHSQRISNGTPPPSREMSASSQLSSEQRRTYDNQLDNDSNTRSRQSSINSGKVKTRRINPSTAW